MRDKWQMILENLGKRGGEEWAGEPEEERSRQENLRRRGGEE